MIYFMILWNAYRWAQAKHHDQWVVDYYEACLVQQIRQGAIMTYSRTFV